MKTLLTLVGLAINCFLIGCAQVTSTKATSKPDAVAVAGQSAIFTVTNTGNSPLHYQWYFNGTNANGVTVTNQ